MQSIILLFSLYAVLAVSALGIRRDESSANALISSATPCACSNLVTTTITVCPTVSSSVIPVGNATVPLSSITPSPSTTTDDCESTLTPSSITSSLMPSSTASCVPTSNSAGCAIDPYDPNQVFELFEPTTGIPIVSLRGRAALAPNPDHTYGVYSFQQAPNTPCGYFDIVYDNGVNLTFLAVFDNGDVRYTSSSSEGQSFIASSEDENVGDYVTSVFSVTCEGIVSAGILDGPGFLFSVFQRFIIATPISPTSSSIDGHGDQDVIQFVVRPVKS